MQARRYWPACCPAGQTLNKQPSMHFTHFTLPRHRSPLFLSCLFGRPECTSVMLAAIQAAGFGGNELCVLVASPRGQTGQTGVPLIEQTMTGHNPGATPLYAAACGGSLRCAKLLCEAGAKIDARTQNDASPLLVSCQVRARQRTQHRPHSTSAQHQRKQLSGPEAPPRHPT